MYQLVLRIMTANYHYSSLTNHYNTYVSFLNAQSQICSLYFYRNVVKFKAQTHFWVELLIAASYRTVLCFYPCLSHRTDICQSEKESEHATALLIPQRAFAILFLTLVNNVRKRYNRKFRYGQMFKSYIPCNPTCQYAMLNQIQS